MERRIGPLSTHRAYKEYVRGLHAFRCDVEAWLANQLEAPLCGWRPQPIASHLRADLNDLTVRALPDSARWPAARQDAFALGVHYVLEGSALGARVLYKQVAALGLDRHYGARHLWAQSESLESWRGFLDVLSQFDGDETPVIEGANAAFNAAADAMERAAHV